MAPVDLQVSLFQYFQSLISYPRALLSNQHLYCGGGSLYHLLYIQSARLQQLTEAKVADISSVSKKRSGALSPTPAAAMPTGAKEAKPSHQVRRATACCRQ